MKKNKIEIKSEKEVLEKANQLTAQIIESYVKKIEEHVLKYTDDNKISLKDVQRLIFTASGSGQVENFVDLKNNVIFLRIYSYPMENRYQINTEVTGISKELLDEITKEKEKPKMNWVDNELNSFVEYKGKKILTVVWNTDLFGNYWSMNILNLFEKKAENLILTDRNIVKKIAEQELNKISKELNEH